ncbi:MAG: diaminopimelate decarboxylase [Planctomycetota bacterium]
MNKFFIGGISANELVEEFGTPLYVYEEDKIREKVKILKKSVTYPNLRLLYACKANSNLEIMRIIHEEGCGVDAVSPGEIFFAMNVGYSPNEILFTGCSISDSEMKAVRHYNILINIDSISQLKRYGKLFPGTEVCIRINPAIGLGSHKHVITGGTQSKFGIYHTAAEEALTVCAEYNLHVVGIHMHVGSNFLEVTPFIDVARRFLKIAGKFKELRFVDFGGGLGVQYRQGHSDFDIKSFGRRLSDLFISWCGQYGRKLQMVLENGRYIVADSGHLIVRVNSLKKTHGHKFVIVDSGFTHLIRPVLYGAHHEIVNMSNPNGEQQTVTIAGNICETGDYFAKRRKIPAVREGDLLSIETAGAYCFSMASSYNGRSLPAEVIVKNEKVRLVRSRESYEDLIKTQKRIINIADKL